MPATLLGKRTRSSAGNEGKTQKAKEEGSIDKAMLISQQSPAASSPEQSDEPVSSSAMMRMKTHSRLQPQLQLRALSKMTATYQRTFPRTSPPPSESTMRVVVPRAKKSLLLPPSQRRSTTHPTVAYQHLPRKVQRESAQRPKR